MTTTDFWQQIEKIINNGFTAEGLTILEDYAEQFITGRIIYKRYSPQEQHGCAQGGCANVIASILAGAEIAADSLTAPVGSFKREQQCAATQIRRIEH